MKALILIIVYAVSVVVYIIISTIASIRRRELYLCDTVVKVIAYTLNTVLAVVWPILLIVTAILNKRYKEKLKGM